VRELSMSNPTARPWKAITGDLLALAASEY